MTIRPEEGKDPNLITSNRIAKAVREGLKELDLTKVPEKAVISRMIKEVKKRYPNLYRVLIEERNEVMARNLSNVVQRHPESKVLAIVGAGHEEEIISILRKIIKPKTKK